MFTNTHLYLGVFFMCNYGIVWYVDENEMQRRLLAESFRSACAVMPDVSKTIYYSGSKPNLCQDEVKIDDSIVEYRGKV